MAREKPERLLNLLLALLDAGRPIPREELRRALLDHYGADQSDETFEKMFERDKDELRAMGIPIETVTNAHNEVLGYRVPRDDMLMPPLSFSTEQMAVLATAAHLWDSALLAGPARSALRKLEAFEPLGSSVDGPVTARVPVTAPTLLALVSATSRRCRVQFTYHRPGRPDETRTLAPWGVVARSGHWYVVGHDVDRDATRVFRVSRIVGDIALASAPGDYDVPAGTDPAAIVRRDVESRTVHATLQVRPGAAMSLRRLAGAGVDESVITVHHPDQDVLVGEIVAQGDAVVVLEPPQVREAVVAHLQAVVDATGRG